MTLGYTLDSKKRATLEMVLLGIAKFGGMEKYAEAVGLTRNTVAKITSCNFSVRPITTAKIYALHRNQTLQRDQTEKETV